MVKFLCQKNCKERFFSLSLWHLKLFDNVMLTAAKPEISLSALLVEQMFLSAKIRRGRTEIRE